MEKIWYSVAHFNVTPVPSTLILDILQFTVDKAKIINPLVEVDVLSSPLLTFDILVTTYSFNIYNVI